MEQELAGHLNAPVVFSHNDLLSGNIMVNDEQGKTDTDSISYSFVWEDKFLIYLLPCLLEYLIVIYL